jgi:hypothetical protein
MPGFDGTGPMGMGPMTGGARGFCNPYGRPFARRGFRQWFGGGRGRGRGYRHMYWATGQPGWMRVGPAGYAGEPFAAPYTKDQEMDFLKDQAAALKEELDAIDSRLRDLESEDQTEN